jgi:L-fuconate dehydratase
MKTPAFVTTIRSLVVTDIRVPTSRNLDGSDVMHRDPDYSAAYVVLRTDSEFEGHGFAFTLDEATSCASPRFVRSSRS